ncbi:NAD(P)H-dependent glycerol-3-phosphate dehydrogenase [Streptomyces sp. NPDC101237]|uniref:NAD(P)H-dependent glycerol-3-phosphate dehydrogenase n=1 Tax=Streptomyces sp. NPDC101237 TaxID=3366139 RepID=UPI00382F775E
MGSPTGRPRGPPLTSSDLLGCATGGAWKNVIALAVALAVSIAVGIAVGMGLGDNATAVIITRGLAASSRLAVAMDADPATPAVLSGTGDLVATCTSPLSRNRTFGTHPGRGLTVDEAAAETRQTTEGVKSTEAVLALSRAFGVKMPLATVVDAVLHGSVSLHAAATELMQRPPKPEQGARPRVVGADLSFPPSLCGGVPSCLTSSCPLASSP